MGANSTHFQAENLQNVQKNAFLAESFGSQCVKINFVYLQKVWSYDFLYNLHVTMLTS